MYYMQGQKSDKEDKVYKYFMWALSEHLNYISLSVDEFGVE